MKEIQKMMIRCRKRSAIKKPEILDELIRRLKEEDSEEWEEFNDLKKNPDSNERDSK